MLFNFSLIVYFYLKIAIRRRQIYPVRNGTFWHPNITIFHSYVSGESWKVTHLAVAHSVDDRGVPIVQKIPSVEMCSTDSFRFYNTWKRAVEPSAQPVFEPSSRRARQPLSRIGGLNFTAATACPFTKPDASNNVKRFRLILEVSFVDGELCIINIVPQ